jgi:glutathione S-transferase
MKLLYTPNSPYARKVRVVAAEKRIEIEMVLVDLNAADCPVTTYNPLGKVPVLVLDDDDTLFDSRVIAEYLDHRTPVAHLIPQESNLKVQVKRWESLADGVCDAAVANIMESRRPQKKQDSQVMQKQMGKVERGLAAMSTQLADAKWCVDDTFSLADIALGCVLGYLELRYPTLEWKTQYPNLAKHLKEMMQRPSFSNTVPPG